MSSSNCTHCRVKQNISMSKIRVVSYKVHFTNESMDYRGSSTFKVLLLRHW